jgi:hypothetical protein
VVLVVLIRPIKTTQKAEAIKTTQVVLIRPNKTTLSTALSQEAVGRPGPETNEKVPYCGLAVKGTFSQQPSEKLP